MSTRVDPHLEVAEIVTRVVAEQGPALLFENPTGFDIPVLGNLFGTPDRVAFGMGAESVSELREIGKLLAFLKEPEPPKGLKDADWLPKGVTADMVVAAALPLTIFASWAFMERPAPQQQGARRGKGEVKPYPLPRLGLESHLDKMRLRTSGECSRRNQMSERTVEPLAYDWAEAVLGSRT